MRTPRRFSQIAAALAAGGMILGPVGQAQAQARTGTAAATASASAGAAPAGQAADLPSRVARLARITGTVSFHTADEDHWDPATLNYPVTSGDAFWTEPQAGASIEVAASRIDMAESTEFDVDQLDDHSLTATQAQGEIFLDLRDMATNESYVLRTPRGTVTIAGPGQYQVASGDTQTPTTITVVQGSAQISGDNLALTVQDGQTATITGSGASGDAFQGSVGAGQRDDFLASELSAPGAVAAQSSVTANATATATASASVTAAPAVVRQMPGGADLSSYGSWQDSPQYGQVWYPRVQQDWVPYRDGHWAYIEPWGWTWVDDEAWGYAPFHYGRWVQVDDRWGWAPVYYAAGFGVPSFYQPIYAPALVSFFGFGAGLAAGLAIGGGVGFGFGLGFGGFGYGHIGWCPLGWGEPYRPWFRAGGGYFDRVNRYNVVNVRNFTYNNNSVHNVTINNYANAARGATVVPTTAMLNSQRAAGVAQPFSRGQFSEAHPIGNTPRPTAATAGVTPRVAQRLGLPDAAAAGAGRTAPGPRVGQTTAQGGVGLRQAARPATRESTAATPLRANPSTGSGNRLAAAGAPAAGAPGAHGGLPPLRSAGAAPRASRGAPGPAFTPRSGFRAAPQAAAPSAFARNESRAGEANRSAAPGPAIAPRSFAANAPASRSALPPLRSAGRPATGFGQARQSQAPQARYQTPRTQSPQGQYRTPPARTPQAGTTQNPAARYQSPQQQRSQAPAYHAPTYHAPAYRPPVSRAPAYQAPRYQAPRYQAPVARAPAYQAPRYQAPQYRAPQYQAPRYQPQPHYAAPAQHFAAPAGRPAGGGGGGGGRRPFPP